MKSISKRFSIIYGVILQVLTSISALGQNATENGQYFFHRENISGNFFDQPKYAIDSIFFFYSKSGDTLTYWTVGSSTPYERKRIKKIEKEKGFGKYTQKGVSLNDGRTLIHELRPTKFLIKNDSLFEWNKTYDISEDSIGILKSAYEKAKTVSDREKLTGIIKKNIASNFVFIFSANLFAGGLEHDIKDNRTKCQNTITLLSKWVINKKEYFRFEITNNCGLWGSRWGYLISNDFDFVTFGGYSSKESKKLTKANLVVNNAD